MDISMLNSTEKNTLALRALYLNAGYKNFRLSKFEEYDFYVQNKDFLQGKGIITFTDEGGKLMALKPDITLSIIKDFEFQENITDRVFYSEKVYRQEDHNGFKEVYQMGLESLGHQDMASRLEVLSLAAASLQSLNKNFILEISHMGFLLSLLKQIPDNVEFEKSLTKYIGEKNPHSIEKLCQKHKIDKTLSDKFISLTQIYGKRSEVIKKLSDLFCDEDSKKALNELKIISDFFDFLEFSDKIHFDFSLINDLQYYNGIVFQGFLSCVPKVVLSGGSYDHLLARFDHKGGGMGFAIYLDFLKDLEQKKADFDLDCILLYDENSDLKELFKTLRNLRSKNKSVLMQRALPHNLKAKQIIDFSKGENSWNI